MTLDIKGFVEEILIKYREQGVVDQNERRGILTDKE